MSRQKHMKRLVIQLDERTLSALHKVVGSRRRQRSEFVRQAIPNAIREAEYRSIREAYRKQPDSLSEVDDWSTAEEYRPTP